MSKINFYLFTSVAPLERLNDRGFGKGGREPRAHSFYMRRSFTLTVSFLARSLPSPDLCDATRRNAAKRAGVRTFKLPMLEVVIQLASLACRYILVARCRAEFIVALQSPHIMLLGSDFIRTKDAADRHGRRKAMKRQIACSSNDLFELHSGDPQE